MFHNIAVIDPSTQTTRCLLSGSALGRHAFTMVSWDSADRLLVILQGGARCVLPLHRSRADIFQPRVSYLLRVIARLNFKRSPSSDRCVWGHLYGMTDSFLRVGTDLDGREYSLNVLDDGTLLMPNALLASDKNYNGTDSWIHRSTDHGVTWTHTPIGRQLQKQSAAACVYTCT